MTGFLKKCAVPIFTLLQSKSGNLIELARNQKFEFKSEKFHFWRNKTAAEKLLLKFIEICS